MFHSIIWWPSSTKIHIAYHTQLCLTYSSLFLRLYLLHLCSLISQLSPQAYFCSSNTLMFESCSHLGLVWAYCSQHFVVCSLISDKFEFKCHFHKKGFTAVTIWRKFLTIKTPKSLSITFLYYSFPLFIFIIMYTVKVTNRFKGLYLIECLKNYGCRFVTLYRKQGSRPSPRKRNGKRQNGCLRRASK